MPRRPRRRSAPVHRPELVVASYARLDRDRARRVGVPEVVLAEGKTVAHLIGIVRSLARSRAGALISRPTAPQRRALERERANGLPIRFLAGSRLVRLDGPLGSPRRRGTVALVTAGTSDVPIAEESRAVLEELGVRTVTEYDVGVAGLHRLLSAVRRTARAKPELYLAFAGREGAMPTVLAGLVPAPVVGVPTSVGYGRGGRGAAALNAMLQSCAPIAVVNIDGAVPAALFAAQWFSAPRSRTSRRRAPR